jgi:hypothetical protein
VPSMRTPFTILSLYSFIGHRVFRPYRPYLGLHVVMVKDSAAHCNAGLFPPIVVASSSFGYVGYHLLYLGVFELHLVAFRFLLFAGCGCLECSC